MYSKTEFEIGKANAVKGGFAVDGYVNYKIGFAMKIGFPVCLQGIFLFTWVN